MTYPTDAANLNDFIYFIQTIAVVPPEALPAASALSTDPNINTAYNVAIATVDDLINQHSPLYYNLAVYNFAMDYLINWMPDQPCQYFFADLRKKWNITGFVGGVVSSTNDNGSGTTLEVPPMLKDFSLFDLQLLKTPYGRTYMSIAAKFGDIWGVNL